MSGNERRQLLIIGCLTSSGGEDNAVGAGTDGDDAGADISDDAVSAAPSSVVS
eukprot:CAMPEP_0185762486 /NCGR_PEP_ID=MMETSP1174-20130828/21453_1 /TAXON_ID=35687 /ORGANISM="Dictyocha speculum, Strain CCMP1381" /LENGTH=52 /DNA_ID=CAMNT_0028444183 /DNA_START=589 /DNA_END=745 /DNA_ORIENTATION=-